jgi:N-acylneuraminate cytidylyltransferase/CMP-N,N'-diacetyllegionaminic acid synthase
MKIVGLIPFWLSKGKDTDLRKLSGRYLINYSIDLLASSSLIDDVVVYSSDDEVLDFIDNKLEVSYKKRPNFLDDEKISTEQIIEEFISNYEADIIVLLHPSCPFIHVSTVNDCIENVKRGKFDSAFAVLEFQKYAWFNRTPLNFDNKNKYSVKLKFLDKVLIEQGLMYVIEKNAFLNRTSRIGDNPYMKVINPYEGLEINSNKDFEIAELIVNSGMFFRGRV